MEKIINSTKIAVDDLVRLSQLSKKQMAINYDRDADVLYVNFGEPVAADDSFQDEEGIIRRLKKNKLVGITVLNASRFSKN